SAVQLERTPARTPAPVARQFRQGWSARTADRKNQPGDAGRDDRHDTVSGELLHEQVPQARLHRLQRPRRPQGRHRSSQVLAEPRPARATAHQTLGAAARGAERALCKLAAGRSLRAWIGERLWNWRPRAARALRGAQFLRTRLLYSKETGAHSRLRRSVALSFSKFASLIKKNRRARRDSNS